MKTKLMAMLLAAGAMLGAWADTETVDGIVWNYTVSNGKAEVGIGGKGGTRAVSTSTTGAIAIPPTLGGYPVTSVGEWAFWNCSGLTNVTIGGGVTSIGDCAFRNCSGLTSMTIPDGVTSLGSYGFASCGGLTNVTIGAGVTSIGPHAFDTCRGLTSVTIPDGVTSIGHNAFQNCSGLTSVTIPYGVTSIGQNAFENCSDALFDTTTISGVKLLGGWAFGYTTSLSGVRFYDRLTLSS